MIYLFYQADNDIVDDRDNEWNEKYNYTFQIENINDAPSDVRILAKLTEEFKYV